MTANRVAVVTGGSAGIGRAVVRRLADQGFDVAVLARGRAGIDGAAQDVRDAGQRALAVATDVAVPEQVEAAAEQVESALGPIDVWINNAFVGALRFSWDMDLEEFRRITDVTYYGQVHGTQTALARMRPRDRGSIVNVSSSLAHRGIPLQAAYCGAKHAIKGYTESVRTELAATGSAVTVSMVTLPGVNTPQFNWNDNDFPEQHPMPVPTIYQPETAARAIVDVARRPRHDAWVGVPTVGTVLGNRLAPGIVDWQLQRTGIDSQLTDEELPRYGSNVFEAADEDVDRGSRGPFDGQAHDFDPVSWLGARVGRAVATTTSRTLGALSSVMERVG